MTLGTPSVAGRPGAQAVGIDVTFDVSRVAFTREGDRHVAALDVTVFCGDSKERPIGEIWKRVDLNLTNASYDRAMKDGMTVRVEVPVKSTPRHLKAVVYDFGADLVGTALTRIK